MRNDWAKILENLKPGEEEILEPNSKILIVDSLNTFMRCFAVINHLNPSGDHIGGLTGFLKSVAYAIRLTKPTKVVLVFDGQGSNTNKRYLYPEYKANRNIQPIKSWGFDSKDEEEESMVTQLTRLIDYLNNLPVHLLCIDKIEADDVIGYLSTSFENEVVIMSSDRDFLQLISDKVTVYSPTKKKFYKSEDLKNEYGVWPNNYLIYKSLLGDKNDNVPNVKSLGKGKIYKYFPELGDKEDISIDDILRISEEKKDNKKPIYERIVNFKQQLKINEQLMDLINPNIPGGDIQTIEKVIFNSNKTFNRNEFIKLYNEDKLGEAIPKLDFWLDDTFRYLTAF